MARKRHVWYPGAILHVMARGNRKSDIFKDKEDYESYLGYIEEAMRYFNNVYHIMAFTLMTNHIHLEIETEDRDISDFVRRVNGRYATSFNKKYDYIGHVFQGRYRAELLGDDRALLEVSRYIHLNPVRARMVHRPEEYKWSSYGMYLGRQKTKDSGARQNYSTL